MLTSFYVSLWFFKTHNHSNGNIIKLSRTVKSSMNSIFENSSRGQWLFNCLQAGIVGLARVKRKGRRNSKSNRPHVPVSHFKHLFLWVGATFCGRPQLLGSFSQRRETLVGEGSFPLLWMLLVTSSVKAMLKSNSQS